MGIHERYEGWAIRAVGTFEGLICHLLMAHRVPRGRKHELRDALLISLGLAISLISTAIFVSAHL